MFREEKTTPSPSARPNFLANLVSRRKGAHSPATFPKRLPPIPSPPKEIQNLESNKKIQIVGAHLEPEVPEEEPLHLGVFKPKAGIREKLRETLHEVLLVEMASRPTKDEGEDQSTLSP